MALCYRTCMRPYERVETTGNMVPKNWQKSSQKALTINRKEGKNCDEQQFISYAFLAVSAAKNFPSIISTVFAIILERFLVVV